MIYIHHFFFRRPLLMKGYRQLLFRVILSCPPSLKVLVCSFIMKWRKWGKFTCVLPFCLSEIQSVTIKCYTLLFAEFQYICIHRNWKFSIFCCKTAITFTHTYAIYHILMTPFFFFQENCWERIFSFRLKKV